MKVQMQFKFPSEQLAYRFLNTATHFDADDLTVKLGQSEHHVSVCYQYRQGEFDRLASQLDDLAAKMDGEEV